ncbi:7-cyano-7-deazaguanine synthase [candidate division KSB1 bacterium]|nr:7-cyano-7-deazaguanine synthase [candidate division KSB1 bacterium]
MLPEFIKSVFHLPNRIQDLLEIAAYIFCADRYTTRGARDNLEFHSWSRHFQFFIKVRDANFWNRNDIKIQLGEALEWMTGDRKYEFEFLPGHRTAPVDMLDSEEHAIAASGTPRVVLFSGGLDSLAGTVDLLETTNDSVWPISHNSANTATIKTQRILIDRLQHFYKDRINHHVLQCHLHGLRAPEESQRTRAFLYCSMAYAMAIALGQPRFYVYENGITALNFPKRSGMINARASRTAHPKTLRLLQRLFCSIFENSFAIESPFAHKTKSDVVGLLKERGRLDLLNSSVSCSKTFKDIGQATHCGECSQCIDRRFAAYATACDGEDYASGYAFDFITGSVENGETRSAVIDYLCQAKKFLHANIGNFQTEMMAELADAVDDEQDEVLQIDAIHSLCQRHGKQIQIALRNMIDPLADYPGGSLKTLSYGTDLSRPPVIRLANELGAEIEEFIRRAFVKEKPKNENDLNAKIDGYLAGHKERFRREHPCLRFATARFIPDHSNDAFDLLIETKYIRNTTSPSKASEGIAADLTKYPEEPLKLFLVYDPDGQISDRQDFKDDFEKKRNCIVWIV